MYKKAIPWLLTTIASSLLTTVILYNIAVAKLPLAQLSNPPTNDRSVIAAIVEDSINDPHVQKILHDQIMIYLKSADGKAKLAAMMKSPEMLNAMADNISSPELSAAIIKLAADPRLQTALLSALREAPELRLLRQLESVIEWELLK